MKPLTFQLLAAGRRGAEVQVLDYLRRGKVKTLGGVLAAMYDSLELLVGGGRPDRMELAVALSRRYERFLSKVAADTLAPPQLREEASRSRRLLERELLVGEFARSGEALYRLKKLESTMEGRLQEAAEPASGPLPRFVRGESPAKAPAPAAQSSYKVTLLELERDVMEKAAELERRAGRAELGGRLAHSKKGLWARELEKALRDLPGWAARAEVRVKRFAAHTLRSAFVRPLRLDQKKHSIIYVPDHKDLRLEPAGKDAWTIKASFDTDIQDPAKRAEIKASIEKYWKGTFAYGGRTLRIAAELTLNPVSAAQAAASASLRLLDGGRSTSRAGGYRIWLGEGFHFGVPAHEFGHILGLPDEYVEDYDVAQKAAVFTKDLESLMGNSLKGRVLERHLKTVFGVLKRRSVRSSTGSGS